MSSEKKEEIGYRETFNIFFLVLHVLSLCFTPFLRRGFGSEALRWGWLSLLLMFLYAGFGHCPEMFIYMGVWICAVVIQRLETASLIRKGIIEHSRFHGYSMFKWIRKCKPGVGIVFEMLVCVGVGLGFMSNGYQSLGGFFVAGAFALVLEQGIKQMVTHRKVQFMRDAHLEQQYVSDLYRGRRDDF